MKMGSKKKVKNNNISVKNCRACVFCKKEISDELNFGGLKATKNLRAHYYCLLFSETIKQSGQDNEGILGFMPMDILNELRQSKQKQCCYCKEFDATLGCLHIGCNRKFHLPCGIANNVQLNFNSFSSLCHKHRQLSNIPVYVKKALNDYKCVICLENFNSSDNISNIIWASCCRSDIVLHIHCIKELTLNAGYFTKCPGCNNKNEFINVIKSLGVFVPERDASWELERNAFSELLYVHNRCDVADCVCPEGRNYTNGRGQWKLMLCRWCGSFGAHVSCSMVKKQFLCDVCKMDKRPALADPNQSNIVITQTPAPHAINSADSVETAVTNHCSISSTDLEKMSVTKRALLGDSLVTLELNESLVMTLDSTGKSSINSFDNQKNILDRECEQNEIAHFKLQLSPEKPTLSFGEATVYSRKRKFDDLECNSEKQKYIKTVENHNLATYFLKCDNSFSNTVADQTIMHKNNTMESCKEQLQVTNCSMQFVQNVEKNSSLQNFSTIKEDNNCINNKEFPDITNFRDINKDFLSTTNEFNKELEGDNENSPAYKISLDINSEIEFVASPNFTATHYHGSSSEEKNNTEYENISLSNIINFSNMMDENLQENIDSNKEIKQNPHKLDSGICENKIQTERRTFSEIIMQKRFIPRYRKGRRIIKINFGNNTPYCARIPFENYNWNYKFVHPR